MDKDNFSDKHDAVKFQEKIEQCLKENEKTLVVRHHREKYGGRFPLWVIVEFFLWECYPTFIKI